MANARAVSGANEESVRSNGWCTPGRGVSVGVEVPCRRVTFMSASIPEDNYESKARASPRGGV